MMSNTSKPGTSSTLGKARMRLSSAARSMSGILGSCTQATDRIEPDLRVIRGWQDNASINLEDLLVSLSFLLRI
jgi:hypothetical protein